VTIITATTNLDKANLLNATFASNFNSALPRPTLLLSVPLTQLLCTIYGLLSTLDTTKANGHGDISAKMQYHGSPGRRGAFFAQCGGVSSPARQHLYLHSTSTFYKIYNKYPADLTTKHL